ncbi:CBS domain-containing protein [Streptomyces sp. NBC_00390]|uniref:CBS domain-containing protein n=1 Tax=Streptomyces sp. NBC_00390 TaxID=2975736 RepID=UPI002E2050A2
MMKHDMVGTVMTSDVVRATADTTFREIVHLLDDHRISGLPVVDGSQRVIGVISESGLLAHAAAAEDRQGAHHARWSSLIRKGQDTDPGVMTLTACRLMTRPAVYAYAHESIAEAARIMARHGIERLPVVDEENRLVGIVTRRDLLKVFLRPDAEIRRVVVEDVLDRTCWIPPATIDVEVRDGVVTVSGQLGQRSEIPPVLRLIQQVDGVVSVVDRLTCRYENHRDDRSKEPPPNLAPDRLRGEERRGVRSQ